MLKRGPFHRFWIETGDIIKEVTTKHGAKVVLPHLKEPTKLSANTYRLEFDAPTFFHQARMRASSRRNDDAKRRAIFVEGSLTIEERGTDIILIESTCEMAIYKTTYVANTSYTLELLDSMHFDAEATTLRPYHPLFHVQRGSCNRLPDDIVRSVAAKAEHLDVSQVQIVNLKDIGCENVRIPTPQMDYFSVLSTVVADFFCDPKSKDQGSKRLFVKLLSNLMGQNNLVRHGTSSRELEDRWRSKPPFCAPHWYPESTPSRSAGTPSRI